jgi:polyhydroxybutyrate depolymerase
MRKFHGLSWAVVACISAAACADPGLKQDGDASAGVDAATDDAGLAELGADATEALDDTAAPTDALAAEDVAGDAVVGTDAAADAASDVAVANDAVAAAAGCGIAAAVGTKTATIQFGGKDRTYLVHVPKGYDSSKPTPVVFAFHGLTDSAAKMQALTGFDTVADTGGFLAVYPEGLADFSGGSWNAGNCCGFAQTSGADDVGFTLAALADLSMHFCTDPKRIFATGFSNGAYMAQRLGCEKADVFAAIAPVSGEINIKTCKPSRAISVLEFHGTGDFVVPYGGGGLTGGAWSVDETFAFWRDNAACTDGKAVPISKNGDATCTGYSACKDGAAIELCVIDKGGHQWPNSPTGGSLLTGKMSKDIDASSTIWTFFQAHPLF